MTVTVVSKYPIYDQGTTLLIIPEGAEGTVTGVEFPPKPAQFHCAFTVGVTVVNYLLRGDQLYFKDGPVGAIRALIATRNLTVDDVIYPTLISETDLILANSYHADTGYVRFKFTSGVYINVKTNQSTGELDFELDYQH